MSPKQPNRTPQKLKVKPRKEIPNGWVKTTLGGLVQPSREHVSPYESSDLPYVGLEHIEAHTMKLLGHGDPLDNRSSSLRFSKGDVLYGRMRPYLNKVWVAAFDGICSAEFLVFGQPEVDSQFLALRLNAEDFVTFANGEISGERPRVDFDRLAVFPILLPPLPEQKRLVGKLIAALSEVERAEKATARAQERLKRYRTVVLEAAVTGELTKKWRADQGNNGVELNSGAALLRHLLAGRRATWEETELKRFRSSGKLPRSDKWKARYVEPAAPAEVELPKIPRKWTWATVEQITTNIATGATPYRGNPAYWDGGKIPWVTSGAINNDVITSADEFITDLAIEETNAKVFPAGTLLVALYGEGKTRGMVSELGIEAATNQACVALIFADYNESQQPYLKIFLQKNYEDMRRLASGGVQPNLNLSKVKRSTVPLPPIGEQLQIVREVERRLLAASQLTLSLREEFIRARSMRESLLVEGFSGRIVAQDSSDEPAAEVIRRIKAARGVDARTSKGSFMTRQSKKLDRRALLDILREHKKPITPEQLFREAGFKPSEADQFYRELTLLRSRIEEHRPQASEMKSWPQRARITIQLKEE